MNCNKCLRQTKDNGESNLDLCNKAQQVKEQALHFSKKFLILPSSRQKNYCKVSNLYCKAANIYSFAQSYEMAAKCYKKSAKFLHYLGDTYNHRKTLEHAAECYRKSNQVPRAIDCYNQLLSQTSFDNLSYMAILFKRLAETYEEGKNYEESLKYYKKSIDLYRIFSDITHIHDAMTRMSNIYIYLDQFQEAIGIFDELCTQICSGIGKWDIMNYVMKGALCHAILYGSCNSYETFYRFPVVRQFEEFRFISELDVALEDKNIQQYDDCVQKLQQSLGSNLWYKHLLDKIRNKWFIEQ